MSPTSSRTIGRVSSPGVRTAMPSAMLGRSGASGRPARLRYIEGQAAACTPTISTSGLSALAAIATPAISPPPPIGTTSTSSSGASVSISSPTVPWPAMICGSS